MSRAHLTADDWYRLGQFKLQLDDLIAAYTEYADPVLREFPTDTTFYYLNKARAELSTYTTP